MSQVTATKLQFWQQARIQKLMFVLPANEEDSFSRSFLITYGIFSASMYGVRKTCFSKENHTLR